MGVAIDSIHDMRQLFEDIEMSSISTSMTINAPATTLLALYVAVAEEKGIPSSDLSGTVQNDILKEYISRGCTFSPRSIHTLDYGLNFGAPQMPPDGIQFLLADII